MKYQFGFIGTGNMGGALAKAAAKNTKSIILADADEQKAATLAEKLGVAAGTNTEVAENAGYIFLAVKPQVMPDALSAIRETLKNREEKPILVTIAAGLSIDAIRAMTGDDYKTIRIMPNTPVEVGEGEILYAKSENTSDDELFFFLEVMNKAGELTELDEKLMNAGCSLSGCGPAFVFMFIRALAKGGTDAGLDEETAIRLATQTVVGAAKLFAQRTDDPAVLIQKVCSPGGSTIEGVKELEKCRMEFVVRKAVEASHKRNIELGRQE